MTERAMFYIHRHRGLLSAHSHALEVADQRIKHLEATVERLEKWVTVVSSAASACRKSEP